MGGKGSRLGWTGGEEEGIGREKGCRSEWGGGESVKGEKKWDREEGKMRWVESGRKEEEKERES